VAFVDEQPPSSLPRKSESTDPPEICSDRYPQSWSKVGLRPSRTSSGIGALRSGPASRSSTDLPAVSLNLLASTQPAAPPPTTATSHTLIIDQFSG
jgi:hypothetical protein